MVATYAAYVQVAERYAPNGRRFAAHVAFYAPCVAEFEDGRATGAPGIMQWGGSDDIVDPGHFTRFAGPLAGIGGGTCRERVVQFGYISVVGISIKQKNK